MILPATKRSQAPSNIGEGCAHGASQCRQVELKQEADDLHGFGLCGKYIQNIFDCRTIQNISYVTVLLMNLFFFLDLAPILSVCIKV